MDGETQELISTRLIVPRPSKLSFLYAHYYKKDKSYQTYLEKIVDGQEMLLNRKVLLMKEKVSHFKLLCTEGDEEIFRAACVDRGEPCK